MLTKGQAAKRAGISKATLSRAIKSGKLSASKNSQGGWDIDPAELVRVYPVTGSANGSKEKSVAPAKAADATLTYCFPWCH